MIGRTISHFRIVEKLGEGGMGVVYKAKDLTLDRTVALKFLHRKEIHDGEMETRFLREARAAAALDHPNICTVHEIGKVGEETFIAMACVEGESLRERIERGPLEIAEAVRLISQVLEGLREAHMKGVVHRDIKPGNLRVTPSGLVKITDFGLAKLRGATELTTRGTTVGTVFYMSPEQVHGEKIDHRTDLWSAGVVLYELLSGRRPFPGDYEPAIIYNILNSEPKSILDLRPDTPEALADILARALAKEPDARYPDADRFLADLQSLAGATAPSTETVSPRPLPRRVRARGRRDIFAVGAAILACISLLYVGRRFLEETPVTAPRPIAVISFENQTGDSAYNYLREVIPNLLITSLEQSNSLRVTTRERMHDLLRQAGKDGSGLIDPDLGFELCRADGVDAVVIGSFTKAGETFAMEARVLDVRTKNLLASARSSGKGPESILVNQIDDLSRRISKSFLVWRPRRDDRPAPIAEVTTPSMEAYAHFVKGRDAYERQYIEEAVRHLWEAIEIDSAFALAYYYLTWACDPLGDVKEKNRACRNARRFSGRATEKGKMYIEAAYARFVEQNSEREMRILTEIVERFPKEKRAIYLLANYYRNIRLHEAAIHLFGRMLELDPTNHSAINLLGYTYGAMGDYKTAHEFFARNISLLPDDANPHDSMSDLYFWMGRIDDAISELEEALILRPDFRSAQGKITYLRGLREEYPWVLEVLQERTTGASSQVARAHAYRVRSLYLHLTGQEKKALHELDLSANLASASGNEGAMSLVELTRAFTHCARGESDLAREHASRWILLERKYSPARHDPYLSTGYLLLRGLVDLQEGEVESARARRMELESLLPEVDPRHHEIAEFWHHLLAAEIHLAEGRAKDARDQALHARAFRLMDIHDVAFTVSSLVRRDALARAYLEMGDRESAIEEYERLTSHDGKRRSRLLIDPHDHYRLAKLYEEVGRPAEAIERYGHFLSIMEKADLGPDEIGTRYPIPK